MGIMDQEERFVLALAFTAAWIFVFGAFGVAIIAPEPILSLDCLLAPMVWFVPPGLYWWCYYLNRRHRVTR